MDTSLLQRFTQLIMAHTGLQIRAEDTGKLRHTIRSRMTAQQLINPEAYYQLLASDTAASRGEWEELVLPLTIGESYFFRDSGQISLLRQRLIPELIERKVAGPETGRLDRTDPEFHQREYERLRLELERAFNESPLPDAPSGAASLHDLLVRIRLEAR